MARTSNEVKADIRQIDRRIDGIRLEIYRRIGRFNTQSCLAWQAAWERCPDLQARDRDLYEQRGHLQTERDAALEREYRAEQRQSRKQTRKAA